MDISKLKGLTIDEFLNLWGKVSEYKEISLFFEDIYGLDTDTCNIMAWFISHKECTVDASYLAQRFRMRHYKMKEKLELLAQKGYITLNDEDDEAFDSGEGYSIGESTIKEMFGMLDLLLCPLDIDGALNEVHSLSVRVKTGMSMESVDSLMYRLYNILLHEKNMSLPFCIELKELCDGLTTDIAKCALIKLTDQFATRGIQPTPFFRNCLDPDEDICSILAKGIGELITKGLVITVTSDGKEDTEINHIISPEVCRKLFRGMSNLVDYTSLSDIAQFTRTEDIKEKELFFDGENKIAVDTLKRVVDPDVFSRIGDGLEKKGMGKSINCLLYGAPGTGKTELAMQLARSSGRDLVIADPASMSRKYVGESEKAYRKLFMCMRYLNALSTNPPILLFNEADAILGRRINEERSNDKFCNVLQAILLQELESFEGIFFATTNLEKNLDPAFERRFLYKLKFDKPSEEVRYRIWRNVLPQISKKNSRLLAQEYIFSGGQVNNIARKVEIFEILNQRKPKWSDIVGFCHTETINDNEPQMHRSVIRGF